jgi:flagellar hook assembly protein FlgD
MDQTLVDMEHSRAYRIRALNTFGTVTDEFLSVASANGILHFTVSDAAVQVSVEPPDSLVASGKEIEGHDVFRVVNVNGQVVFEGKVDWSWDAEPVWDGKDNDGRRVASGWYGWTYGFRRGRMMIVR